MTIKQKHITVIARRWFGDGNTYHSVKVFVNGELIGYEPYTYGYDAAYHDTALKLLLAAGIYDESKIQSTHPILWQVVKRDNNDTLVDEVVDVPRRKDL